MPPEAALTCRVPLRIRLFRAACILALLCPSTVWLSAGVVNVLRLPVEEQEEHPASHNAGAQSARVTQKKSRWLRRIPRLVVPVAERLLCRTTQSPRPADGHRLANGLAAPLRC